MSRDGQNSQTVLILAPTANDGKVAAKVLTDAGLQAVACRDIKALCEQMGQCGAVILSEEALTFDTIECVEKELSEQETWSDLPIILLTSADVVRATKIFSKSGNISLLERPFSQITLIRSVEVALRAREKQYEVRKLLKALKASKDEAERANVAKSEFLANMSHEIRTPIGAIMGFIDLIKNSDGSPDENEAYMGIIGRNSQQLLRLIDDILDLSKVEAGKMTVENLRFKLGEFLTDLSANMTFRASEKGLDFKTKLATAIPDEVATDPVRLRQIISNVVGNAIKFTDSGSIELTVSFSDPILRFVVKDTGVGLTEKQAGKLFQPFVQADSSTTRKFGGTGLGLALSRRLAQALGGDLSLVSSGPGLGSAFAIEIRLAGMNDAVLMTKDQLIAEPKLKSSKNHPEVLLGMKILLVEDSPDNQLLISTYLRKTGARIVIKSNGFEGTEAALTENYDLVLMDVQMPVMDGHEAAQKLRKLHYSKPIIALTAHAMNEERLKCLASGFDEHLTKPIQKDHLIEVLKRYVPAASHH